MSAQNRLLTLARQLLTPSSTCEHCSGCGPAGGSTSAADAGAGAVRAHCRGRGATRLRDGTKVIPDRQLRAPVDREGMRGVSSLLEMARSQRSGQGRPHPPPAQCGPAAAAASPPPLAVHVAPEVAAALREGRPVVALESTIISHGGGATPHQLLTLCSIAAATADRTAA
jgi:hypothetical protein